MEQIYLEQIINVEFVSILIVQSKTGGYRFSEAFIEQHTTPMVRRYRTQVLLTFVSQCCGKTNLKMLLN
jgi:hypothetical protein